MQLRNLLLVLEYDGSSYSGWQVQKGVRTVQGTLERVLSDSLKEKIRVCASGRTDAGVHALGQVANFYTTSSLSTDILFRILKAHLPEDLRVLNLFEVSLDFHARKTAVRKRYLYVACLGDSLPVFLRRYVYSLGRRELDVTRVREGSRIFLGTHDFTSFSSPRERSFSPVRTVFSLEVYLREPFLFFDIQADGFLYHMVRFMVGELLMVGFGKKDIADLEFMLAHPSCTHHRFSAPPEGLYLLEVQYPDVDPYQGLRLKESGFIVPLWVREDSGA